MRQLKFSKWVYVAFAAVAIGPLVWMVVVNFPSRYLAGPKELRVSFPISIDLERLDPVHIRLAPEYIFLENVFSPLVEFDQKGKLVSGIASEFGWSGNRLVFKIRGGVRTHSGHEISADDAAYSLKRLLILASATHGDLKSLICQDAVLSTPDSPCDDILVEGNQLILIPKKKESFLLPLLASIDFAVIPRPSIDPKTLKIIDFKNTSGPYFVEALSSDGGALLKKNESHYHAEPGCADTIRLIKTDSAEQSEALIRSGGVDHLTTMDHLEMSEVLSLGKELSRTLNLHVTMNIRSLVGTFTERGLDTFDLAKRQEIADGVRSVILTLISGREGYETPLQIFPVFGEAGITDSKLLEDLQRQFGSGAAQTGLTVHGPIKIRILRLQLGKSLVDGLRRVFPEAEIEDGTVPVYDPNIKSIDEQPHIFISGPDMGYTEDFSLISYYMAAGYFGFSEQQKKQWLADYRDLDSKIERLEKLRTLHFQTMRTVTTFPIAVFPYAAVAVKPWILSLPSIFADNQLWLLKYQ